MKKEKAIELAKKRIGEERAAKQKCDYARYTSRRQIEKINRERKALGSKPYAVRAYWMIGFRINWEEEYGPGAVVEPEHNLVIVDEDGNVEEMPVL